MKNYIYSIINNNLRYSSNCERRDDDRITTRIPDIRNPDIGNPDIGKPDIVGILYVGIPCVLYGIPTIGSACGIILNSFKLQDTFCIIKVIFPKSSNFL